MTVETFIKQAHKSGLVIIPRKEYEELLGFRRTTSIYKPTKAELKSLAKAEKQIAQGKYTPWAEVKNELAHIRRKRSKKAVK